MVTYQSQEEELVRRITQSETSNDIVSTNLQTDERVIARVTDGIYRLPGSAIRELVSNAYDADASRVVIKTDAPRFDKISVEDNGVGMTPEALAHMLLHIGGSAKRQNVGKSLGVTNAENSLLSPSGRKLIGKIGIGVFSVSQLTHTFQIITKTKGDKFRTVATVAMKQYSDEGVKKEGQDSVYESGKVNIWRERAEDIDAQGTTIVLTSIKPQARDNLRSTEIWEAIMQSQNTTIVDEHQSIVPPKYHIGTVDKSGEMLTEFRGMLNNVPWDSTDDSETAFKKLVQSVWNEISIGSNQNPQLDKLFDNYLQMVWQLSLAIPLNYVEGHLFDMDLSDWAQSFHLSNDPKGAADQLNLSSGKSIRNVLNLEDGVNIDTFEVFIDDLRLSRPIKYKGLPTTGHAIKNPLIFIGKCKEQFDLYPTELSGGPLEFEAYLFWNPKIAPTEHRGSLIRINGASGTLFDPSFMRYQVSEQTRLKQITCEIFVHKGFDSALNIDREAFNYSHLHAVFLTRWLHSALRQLATAQKRVAQELRNATRVEAKGQSISEIQKIALKVWQEEFEDTNSFPPSVDLKEEKQGVLTFDKENIPEISYNRSTIVSKHSTKTPPQLQVIDEKIKAIIQVLASFGLLDTLSKPKQEKMFKAIYQILETSE